MMVVVENCRNLQLKISKLLNLDDDQIIELENEFMRKILLLLIISILIGGSVLAQQVSLIKNINASASINNGSYPSGIVRLGSLVIYSAHTPTFGNELWVSDGTPSGTVQLKDIYVGGTSSSPNNLVTI